MTGWLEEGFTAAEQEPRSMQAEPPSFQFPIIRDAFDEPQTVQVARQGEVDKIMDEGAALQ
jgi:hypothetical protein